MATHRGVQQEEVCARNAVRPVEQRVPQEVLLAHFESLEAPQPARFHWESSCVVLQSSTDPELVRMLQRPFLATVLLCGVCLDHDVFWRLLRVSCKLLEHADTCQPAVPHVALGQPSALK